MMTPNREDYIKIIFNSNQNKKKLTNKELAFRLSVSAASTSEMIRKLRVTGHVAEGTKDGIRLTDKGRKEAKDLVRKHRLWEVFLVDHLDYSWTEVHADAEVLEHVTSNKLADRLDAFLNNPKYCPHGEVIFGNVEDRDDETIALNNLSVNDHGVFKRVRDTGELLEYLEDIKFNLEDEFIIKEIQQESDAILIEVEGKEIVVSDDASKDIYVLLLNS